MLAGVVVIALRLAQRQAGNYRRLVSAASDLVDDSPRGAAEPGEPSVLSNLGMSYMLTKELPKAEEALRQAMASPKASSKVRQNLGLVVGLQGRFADAEQIVKADLPPDEAAANVAYLREMLKGQDKNRDKDNSRPGRATGNIPVAELNRPD